MLFLGIISWKGVSRFNGGGGGGGFVFQMGGIGFDGGDSIVGWGDAPPPPLWETLIILTIK